MKKLGILYHPMIEAARTTAEELREFLDSRGFSTWLCSAWEKEAAQAELNGSSLIITIGGDGTILRAAQIVLDETTPITGINLGTLGFMTELGAGEVNEKLPALLAGDGWIDERAMLEVALHVPDQDIRVFHALNDAVVARGAVSRVILVQVSVDDQHLLTYKADGVILATATGSTGYSLAAGGPIMYPQSPDLLLLPIVPHLGTSYPVVLPPTTVVKLTVKTVHEATLSIDGHINLPLINGASIVVKHSPRTTRFNRIHPRTSFYGSLEEKLKGKATA